MNNIAFPKLGISLNISPVAFSIGSKPIYWYALIILSGFLLGLFFVYKTCALLKCFCTEFWHFQKFFSCIEFTVFFAICDYVF